MSERRYTNNTNLSLYAQVYLATDWYDKDAAGLSVTTLLKPVRQVVLATRVPSEASIVDLEGEIANRNGSAIHDGFERAWKNPKLPETLAKLGLPPGAIKRFRVNPTPQEVAAGGIIACYTEVRSTIVINGIKVSGQFDFIGDGVMEDLKNTSTYKFMNTDGLDYVKQCSMYRLMNPEKVTKEHMNITFNFTDWSRRDYFMKPDKYPPSKMLTKRFTLMPMAETKAWAEERVALLLQHMKTPEPELPFCTDKELWRTDPVFKWYKKPEDAHTPGKRSSKNFDTRREAETHVATVGKNIGIIVEKPGEVKACKYCPAISICSQAQALIASGDLVL